MAVLLPLFCSSELMTGAFCLVCLPTHFQIEFTCRAGRYASQHPCVGGKRERNVSQVVHPHFRGDGYRRHLGDLHCALANNVAAQHPAGRAVDDQFAETRLAAVNDCARSRVEAYNRDQDFVCFTGLCFGEAHLGILRLCEAADRSHRIPVVIVGPRTALVAATKPSCIACGTSIWRPVMSPAAKICGVEVRRYPSTFTNPR